MGPVVVFCLTLLVSILVLFLTPILQIKANPLGQNQLLGSKSFVDHVQTENAAYKTHKTEDFTQAGKSLVNSHGNTQTSHFAQQITNSQREAIDQKDSIVSHHEQGLDRTGVSRETHENQHISHFERQTAVGTVSRNSNSNTNNFGNGNSRHLNQHLSKTDVARQSAVTKDLSSEHREIHNIQSTRNLHNAHHDRRTEVNKVSQDNILSTNENFKQVQHLQQSRNVNQESISDQSSITKNVPTDNIPNGKSGASNALKSQQSLTTVTDTASTESITNNKEINKQTETAITDIHDQSTGYVNNNEYSADHISQATEITEKHNSYVDNFSHSVTNNDNSDKLSQSAYSPSNKIATKSISRSTSVAKNNIYKNKQSNQDDQITPNTSSFNRNGYKMEQPSWIQNRYNTPNTYPEVDFEDLVLLKLIKRMIRNEIYGGNGQNIQNCGSGFFNIGKNYNDPDSTAPQFIGLVLPDEVLEMKDLIDKNRGIESSNPYPVYVKQCGGNQQIILL